ncbi:MAG TPA: hypothetical protein VIV58_33300 [Kofleriaceae bacterium]
MRTWPIALALTLAAAGCGKHSSLLDPGQTGGAADELWDLAPDGVEVGIVATPRAIGLVLDAVSAVQTLVKTSDFAPMKPTAQALIAALLGRPDAMPADAGLARDRGFAMFITADGVLGVMPVIDRDKFMATKHGKRGDVDTLNGNTCKPLRHLYVCATNDKLFDRLGKGSLRGKVALAGGRGDIELYGAQLPLFGGGPGDLAIAVELDPGAMSVRGVWTGAPAGTLGALSGVTAAKPAATNASGFVSFDLAKLLGDVPPVPIVEGVTADALAKSLAGPITAVIPAGTVDIQITVPLLDPAPMKTVLEHCKELSQFLDLTEDQPKDACRFRMQSASVLELEAWVDEGAKQLRVGAHRGPASTGVPSPLTPIGRELAQGDWTGVFWGRGTMLNLTGITPTTQQIPPEGAAALHAISLVNELGVGLKVDAKGVKLRGVLRTAWANPADVAQPVIAIGGDDIIHGRATAPGQALALAHAGAPFAQDFTAGQGGLMVPAAALGIATAIVIPALGELLGGATGPDEPPAGDQSVP